MMIACRIRCDDIDEKENVNRLYYTDIQWKIKNDAMFFTKKEPGDSTFVS